MGRERDKSLISMCKAAKQSFPNTLVGAYYGYLVTSIYLPVPYDPDSILREGDIDFFSRPYSYDARTRLAGGSGLHAHCDSHAKRFGKITFIEADIRSHLVFASKNWRCRSPEETRAVFSRDLGNMITNGTGIQFYAVHDHFGYPAFPYSAPECLEPIASAIGIWKEAFDRKVACQRSSVAMVYDLTRRVNGFHTVRRNDVVSTVWEKDTYGALAYAGRSFDIIDVQSFLQGTHHYNLVIFPEAFTLDARTRAALRKKLDRPDTAALWIYAPGLNDPEKGFREENMLETTGIRLKLCAMNKFNFLDMMVGATRFWNRNYNPGKAWGERIRVYADDPDAVVVGRWMDDQRPSFVLKKLPGGGLSVFCGTAITAPNRWMMIFDALGIPALVSGETYVHANSRYITIPLAEGQSETVTLPRKCSVRDAWTGQAQKVIGNTVKLIAEKPRTWLLEVSEPLDLSVKLNPVPLIVMKLSGIRTFDGSGKLTFRERTDWQSVISRVRDGVTGSAANGREMIGRRFVVDPGKRYRLSGEFRCTGVPGNRLENFFFGFAPYAESNIAIAPETIRPMSPDIFRLAKAVNPGDLEITVKGADWKIDTAFRCIAFDAAPDFGDLPNFNLSPRIKKGSEKRNPDGTLTVGLSAPMTFARPAGTAVRLHSGDALHIYAAAKNAVLTGQWQSFSGIVSGEAVRGAVHDRWWHGTRSAAPIFRYAGKPVPEGMVEFRNIQVEICPTE